MRAHTCAVALLAITWLAPGALASDATAPLSFEARLATAPFALPQEESELPPTDKDRATTGPWNEVMRHRGFLFRLGGMVLEPQNDGYRRTGEPITFDTGGGVSIASGYRFVGMPLTVELEYAYRTADATDRRFDRDADIDLHTITGNLTYDACDLLGPVGVYAGLGAGIRIQELHYSSIDGRSTTQISGTSFFWQARAGLTVSLGDRAQLYGGVIWADAGDIDENDVYVETEMLGAEFGFRFFF